MAKKRTSKKKSSNKKNNLRLINSILIVTILLMFLFISILFTIDSKEYEKIKEQPTKIVKQVKTKVKDEFDEYIKKIEVKKEDLKNYSENSYKKEPEKKEETRKKRKKEILNKDSLEKIKNPKLAIIFDDVTTQSQINRINNIGYKTTLSLLPPTKGHPNSAKIAKTLAFYMIHLPLQAKHFKGEEKNTLRIGDSYEKIEKRVSQIRQWYPNAKYTNNHTGSKFTSNKGSMDKLFKALKKYNFIFMDSRTTSETVVKNVAQKYKMPYIARDIFLDNKQEFNYIQNQLKKAIKISKNRGYAIAICHPHSITIDTLRQSKYLLKDLDLVYLNELPILER